MEALSQGLVRVHHLEAMGLHTRLVSTADSSLLPHAPLTCAASLECADLRVQLTGSQHEQARAWFENLFGQATNISEDVRGALLASWVGASPSARDLYHKVLAEYFRDVVEGLDATVEDNPLLDHLTEFQRDAYVYAKSILTRYGGVFLADVVGLGKTFIALALLAHFQRRRGEHAVVVAPPAVHDAWEQLAKEHRIELALVSTGKLSELHKYSDREVLVIDESHNFRNRGTQRYDDMQEWLRPNGSASSRKVILLSATPQNNRPEDVKHQLELFPDNYTRLPYRGESLDSWFRAVSARQASLVDMLQHVVVRRTRRFIQQAHPDAMIRVRVAPGNYEKRPLRFPRRVSGEDQTLRYSIDDTYGGRLYESLLKAFHALRYPLHGLGVYALENAASHPVIGRLKRSGTTVRGLYKVLLLKRLESSVVALHTSLCRLRDKLSLALKALGQGNVVVGASQLSGDDDDESLLDDGDARLPSSLFDAELLQKDLAADLELVFSLVGQTSTLLERPDAKVERLKQYLDARPPTAHRTLIFTQFADTAAHLGRRLDPGYGRVEVTWGGGAAAMSAARRFSPKAHRCNVPAGEQTDLLISTDALSEGVNLQDADTLINYDLHWNPVRLIQRAGRIDRIGSEHDEIHVSSFLPERALEAQLRLEAVLRQRIHEFVTVFGEDSYVLPASEKPSEDACLRAYTGEALKEQDLKDDDLDGLSRHNERLLRLRREEHEEYARILELRLGQHTMGAATRSIVAMRRAWFWTFWTPGVGNGLVQLDVLQAMDLLHEHSLGTVPADFKIGPPELQLIENARAGFEPLAEQFGEQRTKPRLSTVESYALQQVDRFLEECPPAQRPLVKQLRAWIREGHSQIALGRFARQWKAERLPPQVVFEQSCSLMARFPARVEELGESEVVAAVFGKK
jgi:superfamily II DNA or RNA helicase